MPCILMTVSRHVRPAPNHPPGRTPGISAATCLRHFLQYLRTTIYWMATSLPSRISSITRKATSAGSAERGWPRGQAHKPVSLFPDIGDGSGGCSSWSPSGRGLAPAPPPPGAASRSGS